MDVILREEGDYYILLNLRLVSMWLQGVKKVRKSDFIYASPPYYDSEEGKKLLELYGITI